MNQKVKQKLTVLIREDLIKDAKFPDKLNLIQVSLSEANLTGARLARAYLSGADLSGANLTRATLQGAVLIRANLRGVIGADFTGAILQ